MNAPTSVSPSAGAQLAAEGDIIDHSLSRRIYEELRRGIILGTYPQGMRLAEQRLAEELHVSRVPMREALPQLEVDGFIQSLPRRGALVSTWTKTLVNDLFDVRLGVEASAARYAARRVAAGADLEPLRRTLADAQRVIDSADEYGVAEVNSAFHQRIVELTGNEILVSMMRAVSGRVTWLFYLTSQLDAQVACDEHVELLEAIATGNESLAEAVAFAHIEKGRVPTFQALAGLPD